MKTKEIASVRRPPREATGILRQEIKGITQAISIRNMNFYNHKRSTMKHWTVQFTLKPTSSFLTGIFQFNTRLIAIFCLLNLYVALPSHTVIAEEHSDKSDHEHSSEQDEHRETEGNNHAHDKHGDHEEEGFVKMSWDKASREEITIVKAKHVNIKNRVTLHGETALNADEIIHVTPRFPGTITKVRKHLGEAVQKGELLAVIQSNESLAPYDIRASVNGIIIGKDATQGEFVDNDDVIFIITNLDYVWVNAAIHPRDLGRIRVGAIAQVTSQSTGLQYKGKIDYIRPTLTEATRTALARITVPNDEKRWFPGLFVTVEVILGEKTAPLGVPDHAIVLIENTPSIFVKDKNDKGQEGFQMRKITRGASDGETTEILDGLRMGEAVASGRTFILKAELGKGSAEHSH